MEVHLEAFAEVIFAGIRIRKQLLAVAVGDDPAIQDDIGSVGRIQGLPHIVVRQQDTDSSLGELHDDLLDLADGDRVDSAERFVQENETRFHDERPGDLETPLLAAGEYRGL